MKQFFEKYQTEILILLISIVIILLFRKKIKALFSGEGLNSLSQNTTNPNRNRIQTQNQNQTQTQNQNRKADWNLNDIKVGSKLYAKKGTKVIADVYVPVVLKDFYGSKIEKSQDIIEKLKVGKVIEIQNENFLGVVEKVFDLHHKGVIDSDHFKIAKLKYDKMRYVILGVKWENSWEKWHEAETIELIL